MQNSTLQAIRSQLNRVGNALIPLLLVLIATLTCFYRLQSPSMWLDEIFCRFFSVLPVRAILNSDNFHIQLTHGYFILDKLSECVFGNIDFGIRFFDALSAVATVFFVYLLCVHLFSRSAGILCALALSVNPLFVGYCQYNRIYHMGGFAFVAVYYCCVRFIQTRKLGFWFAFIFVSVFFLRTHEYSAVSLSILGLLVMALSLTVFLPEHWRPYTVGRRTLFWLLGAALIAVLLWCPYTLRFIAWALEGKQSEVNFDGFWPGPFPVTVQAVIGFARESFLSIFGSSVRSWQVYLVVIASVLADILYTRGKALTYYLYCLLVTLPIIYVMNASHAAVMAKRLIYLEPPTFMLMACGISAIPRICGDVLDFVWHRVSKTYSARWRPWATLVVRTGLWCWLLWTMVRPVLVQSAYDLGQYYFTERAAYKLTSRILMLYSGLGDSLWWYPPVNDSWLPERSYLAKTAWVKPIPKGYDDVSRESIVEALETGNALWLHQISPCRYGFATSDYVELPIAGKINYVMKQSYFTNEALRLRDEQVMLNSVIHLSEYPEIDAARRLTELLLANNATNEADSIASYIGSFRASHKAISYCREYFIGNGLQEKGNDYTRHFANLYWFVPFAQLDAARVSLADRLYADAVRFAKRFRTLGNDTDGMASEILYRSYFGMTNYALCGRWLDRTLHTLEQLDAPSEYISNRLCAARLMQRSLLLHAGYRYHSLTNDLSLWKETHGAHIASHIEANLSNAISSTEEWNRFRRARSDDITSDYMVMLFVAAVDARSDKPKLTSQLALMESNLTVDTWPVYATARELLQPSAGASSSVRLDDFVTVVSVRDATGLTNVAVETDGWAAATCPFLVSTSPTATNWNACFSVVLPQDSRYQLFIRLAAAESRPFSVSADGRIVCTNASFVTGGLHHTSVRQFYLCSLPLRKGPVSIGVSSECSLAPHISSLVLVKANGGQTRSD